MTTNPLPPLNWLRAFEASARHLATTYSISINAALGDAGLAMGHETLVTDLIEAKRLVRPYPDSVVMEEAYYLLDPPAHAETPASRAFAGWICDLLPGPS